MKTPAEKVAKGAAYMDKIMPNWYKKIKIKIFDISSTVNCVAAQTLKDDNPESPFNKHGLWFESHGFDILSGEDNILYEPLQEAWLQEIRKRKRNEKRSS